MHFDLVSQDAKKILLVCIATRCIISRPFIPTYHILAVLLGLVHLDLGACFTSDEHRLKSALRGEVYAVSHLQSLCQ